VLAGQEQTLEVSPKAPPPRQRRKQIIKVVRAVFQWPGSRRTRQALRHHRTSATLLLQGLFSYQQSTAKWIRKVLRERHACLCPFPLAQVLRQFYHSDHPTNAPEEG
jgi:hypothetical protein